MSDVTFYQKHPDVMVYSTTPLNTGAPAQQPFITPDDQFFIRNHGTVPDIDPEHYRLKIQGLVAKPLELSLEALKRNFTRRTVIATLQCAGNRRRELAECAPIQPGEIIWDHDAISTSIWTGVSLAEVLAAARVPSQAGHVAFDGLDQVDNAGIETGFGGSIPMHKALSPDVLLAYEMNGETLAPVHGYPLRVIVPGYIGARSVKWLRSITVQTEASSHYYQTHAYRMFPGWINPDNANWDTGIELGELPLNSAIFAPAPGQKLRSGLVRVQGYALSGDKGQIDRVEVSSDDGRTWRQAVLMGAQHRYAWRYWEVLMALTSGEHRLVVRAYDSHGKGQPKYLSDVWNFKGYLNNAWHRITVEVD